MTKKRTATEMEEVHTTEVDSARNVILYVEDSMKLRVSSKLLGISSKVFARMFNPHYLEGQNLRKSSKPSTVSLIDDNAQAMHLVCKCLYHQMSMEDESKIDLETLLLMSVIADKYDIKPRGLTGTLLPSVFRQTCLRLRKKARPTTRETMCSAPDSYVARLKFLAACYLMDHQEAFNEATKDLILSTITTQSFSSRHNAFERTLVPGFLHRKCWDSRCQDAC